MSGCWRKFKVSYMLCGVCLLCVVNAVAVITGCFVSLFLSLCVCVCVCERQSRSLSLSLSLCVCVCVCETVSLSLSLALFIWKYRLQYICGFLLYFIGLCARVFQVWACFECSVGTRRNVHVTNTWPITWFYVCVWRFVKLYLSAHACLGLCMFRFVYV